MSMTKTERRVLKEIQRSNPSFGACGPMSKECALNWIRRIIRAVRGRRGT